MEFITLLPLVIPAIIIVFGYLRLYNSSSWLPFTSSARATDLLLVFAYVTLSLPYMYRAVDTGLRTIDVRTSDGSGAKPRRQLADDPLSRHPAECAGGGSFRRVPDLRHRDRRVHHGEPARPPAFGPYLQNIGANQAYEPSALAIIAFAVTWALHGHDQLFGRGPRDMAPVPGKR